MKRGIKTSMLLMLRKLGLLCRKIQPYKPILKIQRSIGPNGESINHENFMFAKNKLQGINKDTKDRKQCYYDFQTHVCRCGITLEQLKNNSNCPLKSQI